MIMISVYICIGINSSSDNKHLEFQGFVSQIIYFEAWNS